MEKKARFDFELRPLRSEPEAGLIHVEIVPDPRRYAEVSIDGVTHYRDRYLDTVVSLQVMAQQMKGLPIYRLQPAIESTPAYAKKRLAAVSSQISGGPYIPPVERATPHKDLHADSTTDIAFLSVDICGSTAYRRKDPSGFERAYAIFMQELGTIVGHFHGAILKTTGDGFIAYIAHPSFTSQCDAALDLGLSLIGVVVQTLNPALRQAGLRPLSIRVGADYGEATTRVISVPTTQYHSMEIASDALNRAVKIEESAKPNQFRIGRNLYELAHVRWLERAQQVPFDSTDVGIPNYQVYRIR